MSVELRGAAAAMAGRNRGLDLLRGIAILLVLVHHYTFPASGSPAFDDTVAVLQRVGNCGVDLFFTLSGYLVGGLLLREARVSRSVDARRFLLRRVLKIWPAFYVLLAVHVIVQRHPLDTFLWQNALQVQNYFGSSLSHTWSLAVEEHFYLGLAALLAVLAPGAPARIAGTLVVLCVASLVARIAVVLQGDLTAAFYYTHNRLDGLLLGVLLAYLREFQPQAFDRLAARRVLLWAVVAATCVWIVASEPHPAIVRSIGFFLQALGFCAAVMLVQEAGRRWAQGPIPRALASLGVYSYGVYLWHTVALTPGLHLIAWLEGAGWPAVVVWVVAVGFQLALGIGVGVAASALIEWPVLRLRERWVPSAVPHAPTAATAAERSAPARLAP